MLLAVVGFGEDSAVAAFIFAREGDGPGVCVLGFLYAGVGSSELKKMKRQQQRK